MLTTIIAIYREGRALWRLRIRGHGEIQETQDEHLRAKNRHTDVRGNYAMIRSQQELFLVGFYAMFKKLVTASNDAC